MVIALVLSDLRCALNLIMFMQLVVKGMIKIMHEEHPHPNSATLYNRVHYTSTTCSSNFLKVYILCWRSHSIKQFFINQHKNSNDTKVPTFRPVYSSLHQGMKTTQKQWLKINSPWCIPRVQGVGSGFVFLVREVVPRGDDSCTDLCPCLRATALLVVAVQHPGSSRPSSRFNLSPTGASCMLWHLWQLWH